MLGCIQTVKSIVSPFVPFVTTKYAFMDSMDQDQTAQNVQYDFLCSLRNEV